MDVDEAALRETGTISFTIAVIRRCRSGGSCSTSMARAPRPGRRRTRYVRACRSTIICRTAARTIITSIASTCRAMRCRQPVASLEGARARRGRPAPLLAMSAFACRGGRELLLNESKSLAAEVKDFRASGSRISVIQAFADKIVRLLKVRDPLSERVHLNPIELFAFSGRGRRRRDGAPRDRSPSAIQTGGRRMTLEATATKRETTARTASGSSFLCRDAHPAARAARGDVSRSTAFCRQVDDIADFRRPRGASAWPRLQQWRDDIDALYHGHPPGRALKDYAASVRLFDLQARGFPGHRSTAWKMDVPQDIRAPGSCHARSLLRPASASRRRAIVGAGIRPRPGMTAFCLPHHLGRAPATHQYPARYR